jgi:hypothetical protein
MDANTHSPVEGLRFTEFRRKVRDSEVLSSSMQRLVRDLFFTGRLLVIIENGHVLKSGYEESYFSHRDRREVG